MDKEKKTTSAKAESKQEQTTPVTEKKTKAAVKKSTAKKPGRPKKSTTAKTKQDKPAAKKTTKAKTTAKTARTTSKAKTAAKAKPAAKTATAKSTAGTSKAAPAKTAKPKVSKAKAAKPKTTKKTTAASAKKKPIAKKAAPAMKAKSAPLADKNVKESAAQTSSKTGDKTTNATAASKTTPKARKPAAKTTKKADSPAIAPPEQSAAAESSQPPTSVDEAPAATVESKPHQRQDNKPQNEKDKNSRQGKKPKGKPAAKSTDKKGGQDSNTKKNAKALSLKLLINAEEPEECRIALLENGKLESFYVESVSRERTKGNIYKGKIVSIETNLQAAFVDIGTGKNAFLPFSEIHPEYYSKELPSDLHWKDVNFRERLKIGQEILLEVVKETTGNKGANMTSFLSLPGRYVVLMPGSESHGISRQIDSQEQRRKLREMVTSCKLPEGVGYIIRTASKGITKSALTEDLLFLVKLWKDIRQRGQSTPAPALIYGEQNIVTRFLRDHFSTDIQEIVVDSEEAFTQVKNFIDMLPATQRRKTSARLHKGPRPLLNSHNIEEQIEQIYQPTVKLPSGGSIVIDPTEALVAIDVNSGSTGKDKNFSETIFMANMEAAEELARQLRLRDLGGLIVVDFIDMRSAANIRAVEKKVKDSMKRDKAKVDFARISKFGLLQISRQRMGSPIAARNYITCECCKGRGIIRSVETQALSYLRQIQTGCTRKNVKTIRCHLPLEVSQYLLNKKRTELSEMERRYRVAISVEIDSSLKPTEANIEFVKS